MTPYTCEICRKPINKNHESYRGRISMGMMAAIRVKAPAFHPRDDICKECGEHYLAAVASEKRPAWMDRPLG